MKNNRLAVLLSLSAILAITGCEKNPDDNSSKENSSSETQQTSGETSNSSSEIVKVDVEETLSNTVLDVTRKFENSKEKSEVLPVKVNANVEANVKVDYSALLPFISVSTDVDTPTMPSLVNDLLKEGVSATANAELLANFDFKAFEEYSKKVEAYNNDEIAYEAFKADLTSLMASDKTQLYVGTDINLSSNLTAFLNSLMATSDSDTNSTLSDNISVKAYTTATNYANQITTGNTTITAESGVNDYAYARTMGEMYLTVARVLAQLPDLSTPVVPTPSDTMMAEVTALFEDAKAWYEGTLTSLELVNKVEAFIIKLVSSEDQPVDAIFTDGTKTYIASVLDAAKALNWNDAFTFDATKDANGLTVVTTTIDFVKLLTNVKAIVKAAEEKLATLTDAADEQIKQMLATFIPVATSTLEAVTPEKLTIASTISIKDGLVCSFGEKVEAKGSVDLAKLNALIAIISSGNAPTLSGTITYDISESSSFSYEIGGKVEVPAVPTFPKTVA